VVGFFAARIAASFTQSLRSDIFNRVLDYSQTEIKKFSIPSLYLGNVIRRPSQQTRD